jgi:hypothetical protein
VVAPGSRSRIRPLRQSRETQAGPVAGRLDDAAAEVGHDRLCSFAAFTYRARSIRLVLAHETRVADDVGGEDGEGDAQSSFGDPCQAHALVHALAAGDIDGIAAEPRRSVPRDSETWTEIEALCR